MGTKKCDTEEECLLRVERCSPRGGGSRVGARRAQARMHRWPCKDYPKGTCNNSGEKCSYAHRQLDEHSSKKSKKNDDKSAVAMLKKNDWHESVW